VSAASAGRPKKPPPEDATVVPAFLVSTPRAGSTLVAAMLDSHSQIHCPPEPWLLLELLELRRPRGRHSSPFDSSLALKAMSEALGAEAVDRAIRAYLDEAYRAILAPTGKRLLVDKTPRYYQILDQILELFPSAPIIWLLRSPLDVVASYKETWQLDPSALFDQPASPNTFDLTVGLVTLSRFFRSPRAGNLTLRYEELVERPEELVSQLCQFLGVPFEPEMLQYGRHPEVVSAYSAASLGDKKLLAHGAPHRRAIGRWRSALRPDEVWATIQALGRDLFVDLGYERELADAVAYAGREIDEVAAGGRLEHFFEAYAHFGVEVDAGGAVEHLRAETARLAKVAASLQGQVLEKEREIGQLSAAAAERLAVIDRSDQHLRELTEQLLEKERAIVAASQVVLPPGEEPALARDVRTVGEAIAEEVRGTREAIAEEVRGTREAIAEEVRGTREAVSEEVRGTREAVSEEVRGTREAVSEEVRAVAEAVAGDVRAIGEAVAGDMRTVGEGVAEEVRALRKAVDQLATRVERRTSQEARGDLASRLEGLGRRWDDVLGRLEERERLRAEESVATQLQLVRAERDAFEAAAEARLRVIHEQQRAIESYRRWRLIDRARGMAVPRLGTLWQYNAVPLRVPKHYHRPRKLTSTPVVSIVTPSFNQGGFVSRTIGSVLDQQYPRLQYVVQDGGSTDDTVAAVAPLLERLHAFESKRDNGQAHAINMGFARCDGEIMAYLNSDDMLMPGAINYVVAFFNEHPDVDVVYGHRVVIEEYDAEVGRWVLPPHDDGVLSWADYVPQETLFWRRRIWERAGGRMDESFRFALDWDLLLRFRDAGARTVRLPRFLGCFRIHPHQKTSAEIDAVGTAEMQRLRERCHGRSVGPAEVHRAIKGYLRRHVVYDRLYRAGALRY
jgi:uncharacterized coiled-coil protein SlyX